MKNHQQQYIEYVRLFAEANKSHIWLSGSFLHGTHTVFSDVDISVFCNIENMNKLIYGYGKPGYISFTHKPLGILIVIYEDGVAVDLEIIEENNGYLLTSIAVKNDITKSFFVGNLQWDETLSEVLHIMSLLKL